MVYYQPKFYSPNSINIGTSILLTGLPIINSNNTKNNNINNYSNNNLNSFASNWIQSVRSC